MTAKNRKSQPTSHRQLLKARRGGRHTFITILVNSVQHSLDQSIGSCLVNIMGDNQKVLSIRRSINRLIVVIHGILDGGRGVLVVIVGVHVKVGDVIAQIAHRGGAAASARRVWGAHVCRVLSNNVADGSLVVGHLGSAGLFTDCGEILMGPAIDCFY